MAARAVRLAERLPVCESLAAMVLKILYWIAVLAISLVLLVALILFFESRDDSSLDDESASRPTIGLLDPGRDGLEI